MNWVLHTGILPKKVTVLQRRMHWDSDAGREVVDGCIKGTHTLRRSIRVPNNKAGHRVVKILRWITKIVAPDYHIVLRGRCMNKELANKDNIKYFRHSIPLKYALAMSLYWNKKPRRYY